MGINVQGVYFHYEKGSAIIQSDIQTRAFLAAMGITLIFIDEDDALKDAKFYVREALQGKDHSRLGAGA